MPDLAPTRLADRRPSLPDLALSRLAGGPGAPDLLVVGPSLGTSVAALWTRCAALLADRCEVLGWDLPGHGASAPAQASFTVTDLAVAVRERIDDAAGGRRLTYAGVSIGGAVGLALALDPGPVTGVAVVASAPRIGQPAGWHERADLVRREGTAAVVDGSRQRWFAPGFAAREPQVAEQLLDALRAVDGPSYALACQALAELDLRDRLAEARVPVLLVAGELDQVVPPAAVAQAAAALPDAEVRVLDGVAHLPPAEDPAAVAALLARTGARR